ncbi:uncharacterized protein LOC108450865 [Gossypium arboreum]|uniref:uncharacterized protein LOC108450865 n=1 Tax=Gossypium arboreum TaxID=29729 RepID=UPI0008196358|nr:uncharacterized protein LOC108450865 [Gossypium arboreum]
MAIKLDLEKAYDKISWELISASLSAVEIPLFLWRVIMSTISMSTMQILWNGVPTQKFKPVRGIRQGCSFSPYLFVLCMDWLSHLIHTEMEVGNWDPIRLSRAGPEISHLFFADDLVIFCKAQKEIAKLDARRLSFAGRVTLAQSVLLSIPNYFMQSLMIPKGVCANIERLVRQFIWGCTKGQSKMALVGWDSICQPRARGGLGFRHLNDKNWSFLMKIGFSLVSKCEVFWVRVLRSKYGWKDQLSDSIKVISRITSIPPPHPDSGPDRVVWAWSVSGAFSVRSTYWALKEDTWNTQEEHWKIS